MAATEPLGADQVLDLYDRALPQVYGYLVRRCGSDAVAEDLTSETFMAAVAACQRGEAPRLSVGWLVSVARNKLVDHWRRQAAEERRLESVAVLEPDEPLGVDPSELSERRALAVLAELGPHHRAALTLRYLDNLGVPQVASELGRTVHATEALLVRARHAFRTAYARPGGSDHAG
jgi:RNA polymerase sigma-70 factor (ECF subfamily)